MGYIEESARVVLARQAAGLAAPPEAQIGAATRVLAVSPVTGREAFSALEVRLVAVYRVRWGGVNDLVWRGIWQEKPEAWAYAVHEAAEMQAFADLGIDPFDDAPFKANLAEAHLRATRAELDFLAEWSIQLGRSASPLAIETVNPLRHWSPRHGEFVARLQGRTGWHPVEADELAAARSFWDVILLGRASAPPGRANEEKTG